MQDDPVIVLFDPGGDLEQLENHGIGLGCGKFGMLECLAAQLLMQHIGGTVQHRPHAVGQEGRARRSVGGQFALHLLDEVLGLPAGAVQLGVHRMRVGQIQ
jgi:hypothetical protein